MAWVASVALLVAMVTNPAAGEPFVYAAAEQEPAAIPSRYTAPLPENLVLNPCLARLETHFTVVGESPKHLGHRACHEGAPEREWIVDAMRRAAAGDRWPENPLPFHLALGGCRRPQDEASLCRFAIATAAAERPGPLGDFLAWRVVGCTGPEAAAYFAKPDVPDAAVVAYHEKHREADYSPRLAQAVVSLARAENSRDLERATRVFGRLDDARVAHTLLALHAETRAPERRRILGLGLREQRDPRAAEVFAVEFRADCERRRALRAARGNAASLNVHGRLHLLGYVGDPPLDCGAPIRTRTRTRMESTRPTAAPHGRRPTTNELRLMAIDAELRERGVASGIHRFAPDATGDYREHAPLLRQLADLVHPQLDDVVFEDVWPEVAAVRLVRGPHRVHAFLNGDGIVVGVRDRGGQPDLGQAETIAAELEAALAADHFVDAYAHGDRLRFRVRGGLGAFADVSAAVGALNTLLRSRGGDWRLLVLEPFDFVEVVAGPRRVLLDAVDDGVLRVGDPLAAARKSPSFRAGE